MNRWRKYFKDFLNFRDNREAKLKYLGKGGVKRKTGSAVYERKFQVIR